MIGISQLGDQQTRELEHRALRQCVVFKHHPLPLGCQPRRGRVGIELVDGPSVALLHVDRSVRYRGRDPEVEEWTTAGTRSFGNFRAAVEWLDQKLMQEEAATPKSAMFIDASALFDAVAVEVIGQDVALRVSCRAAARHLARVEPRRPLTLLYTGPTGVGKTSAAQALAAALRSKTGQPWPFVRLDMSEMGEQHSVSKILGAPPGYVGYRDESQLVTTLREQPRSVVLFDEIEKAHPSVFTAMMNLLDAGRLAGHGDRFRIDARQAIFVLTSNVASDELLERLDGLCDGADLLAIDDLGRAHLRRQGVPPELVGRITHVCPFRPLGRNARREIAYSTVQRVAETYGVQLTDIDAAALDVVETAALASGAGVRGMEYAIDAMLGDLVVRARRDGKTGAALTAVDGVLLLA